ncbi:hypothetical protein H6P81_004494 [Aristolochia fimbriata]|uniref:F-box domain-containing protein n=1 Tax=Aristolochia fimbriata TaxID=158543 RepID=A0AAV7FHR6_ARIFI|nr:hypothetical protein H6P81_004494 [Aristolochia fimbriata]
MDDLPDEIWTEIFRRLPKRLRCKCRCVSKRWSNLISKYSARLNDLGFILGEQAPKRDFSTEVSEEKCLASFFRFDEKGGFTADDRRFFFPTGDLELEPDSLCSCSGLLFFRANNLELGSRNRVVYHVANPVAKRTMVFASYTPNHGYEYFGYGIVPAAAAECSDETCWRLVALYYYFRNGAGGEDAGISSPNHGLLLTIFDSTVGQWIETKEARFSENDDKTTWKSEFTRLDAPALYMNGTLHWLESSSVNTLCLKTLLFRRIALPTNRGINTAGRRALLWESDGRLKYGQIRGTEGFCIWVLEGAGTSLHPRWRKTWHVPIDTLKSKADALGLFFADNIIDACYFVEDLHTVYILMERNRVLLSYDILEETMREMPLPEKISDLAIAWKPRRKKQLKCGAFTMSRALVPWNFNARAKLPNLVGILRPTTESLFL